SRHDNRIGARESNQEPTAAEYEPSLVAVPVRRDRSEHAVAFGIVVGERKQYTDAEIEAVEDDVQHDGDAEDRRPDDRKRRRKKVCHFGGHGDCPDTLCGASAECPVAICSGCGGSLSLMPRAIRRLMK